MKKFLSVLILSAFMNLSAFGAVTEHLQQDKKINKKAPTDIVYTTPVLSSVIEYNIIEVTFAQDFSTKTNNQDETIAFLLQDGLKTTQGTEILPAGTKILANVVQIEKPKMFNKSAKAMLAFHSVVMPDGTILPLSAKIFSKNEKLSRTKLNALGKGLGSTLGGIGVGIGAGCGIGVAAGAVIVGGFAIGLPVGFAIGAIAGLVTPGLHYKAKAGDKLLIQLTDDLEVQRTTF